MSDSTDGLLTTGALLLDLDGVTKLAAASSPSSCVAQRLRAAAARRCASSRTSSRSSRAAPSCDELHVANGLPDWSFRWTCRGLRFAAGEEPIEREVAEAGGLKRWTRCDRPADARSGRYACTSSTPDAGQVTFGNGVNGRIPPQASQVLVNYAVCDGDGR